MSQQTAETQAPEPQAIRPQPGPQEAFLRSSADLVIFGGAAGGGKSYALLIEALRHIANPGFGAVIFRRLSTQITGEGGLWDTSRGLYSMVGGVPTTSPRYQWRFSSGAKVSFAHLQYDQDVLNWQGAQIPLIGFDELSHFSEYQFFYMLSRNRSTCGVRPYVRATTNPDAESWIARLIAWWIDEETGYPIPERAGRLRYFSRIGEEMIWGTTPEEVVEKTARTGMGGNARELVKSITFIPSTLEDNAILARMDPSYKANLLALPRVERERLLGGNWKVRPSGGTYFPRHTVATLDAIPADVTSWVRRWDLAATAPSEGNRTPSATAGVLMGRRKDGRFVVADVVHLRVGAAEVRMAVQNTARQDRTRLGTVLTVLPEDPGQAGKEQAQSYVAMLAGYSVRKVRETGSKETRAEPLAAQWQVGNVDLVDGPWNVPFLAELEAFPDGGHDDLADAAAGAFTALTQGASVVDRFAAMAR